MKSKKLPKMNFLNGLANGKLDGGFEAISVKNLIAIVGGLEANNCAGGNCVAGCGKGQNVVAGCGSTNGVPGCGK